MARIGKGQAFTSNDFKKAIYAIRGNNRQTKGMACSVAIEGQNEGSVLLVTDTWKGPEPITGCRLHRYSRKKQHLEDYRLKPISITKRRNFSLVLCDLASDRKGSFEVKSLHKKCLSGQQLKRDFRVYTIYRDECKVLELIYSDGSYKLIDNGLYDLTLCGSPIIDEDNFKKYLVGVLTTNAEGKVIPCFLSNGVLEEPAFTTHPKNHQTSREGVNITFSSDANGIPEPTFTWTKDGSAVTANDRISVSADNKQLSLTNVNRTDSGEYRCVATNSVGTVNSNVATLTVLYQPEFTAHPQSQTLVEGSSVTFSSDANGITEPTFAWTKDGSSVTADNRITLSVDNKQLSLTNVNRTDNGEYRCVAANSVGTVNSNAATLTVHFPPEFTAHPHSQTSMQGSSATFSSDANGIPEPTFSWSKDGSAVTSDSRISLSADNKQLSITNVNRTDSGEYRCVAANSVGTVYSNASRLTLQGAPGQQQEEFEVAVSRLTSTHDGRSEYKVIIKVSGNPLIDKVELIGDVVRKVLDTVLVDEAARNIRNVEPCNSIVVELHCYTTKSFRSLMEDLENGRVKRRLEEEFEKVGCKGELEVTLINAEEVHEALDEIRAQMAMSKREGELPAVTDDSREDNIATSAVSSDEQEPDWEYSPEQLNYFRVCFIVFYVVAKGLRIIFKREWDIRFKKTHGGWMDKPTNGRDFYVMEGPRKQKRFANLLATMINGNTEEWNCVMLAYAILYSESLGLGISAEVRSAVDDLRNLRNEFAHTAQARFSDTAFFSLFKKVNDAFQSLGLSTRPLSPVVKEFPAECSTEQLNFFKMCYLVSDVVPKGLRMLFKREWDLRFEETLGVWKDIPKNGRDFYSMESPRSVERKNTRLLATVTNGNTEEWDLPMLCDAIMYSNSIGSTLSPAVRSQVHVLRNVRNVTMRSSRATLSVAGLQDIVQTVDFAFRCLGLSTQPVQDLEKQKFQFEPTKGSYDEKQPLEKQAEDLEFEDQKDVSSFCRLPLKPPLDIIGRESDKEKIVQELKKLKKNNEGGLSCLIISGRPGSGKSQLARKVAESFYYDATKITDVHAFVMTLNAESSDSLLESFTSFAQQIKCSEIEVNKILVSEEETSDEKIIRLKNLIQERIHLYTTWLLVIDNVTGVRSIPLPEAGNAFWKTGQMLITTRDTVAELPEDTFTSHISINQGMEPNDAVSLMAAVSGTDDKEMLAKVAKELYYQPLALVNAATCVKHDCQSNEDPNLAWTEILNALRADKEQSVSADVSTPESSIVKYTDVVVRLAVEKLIKNDLIKLIFTFLSLFKRKEFDLHTLITYVQKVQELQDKDVQKVEELQDKEEIRKTSESQIKACPLLLLEEEANNVKIGVHQVVFNGIKSTLKKRSIPDSQIRAAVKLSHQMEIDPL